MEAIPSTLYGILKFEFQDEVHTIMDDPNPYALCNIVDFEYFIMLPPQYEIKLLDGPTLREDA